MKYSVIVLVAGLSALPLAARAQAFIPGNQIVQVCSSTSRQDDFACNGFIAGALDEVSASPELRGAICVPKGTPLKTLRAALVKFAREHADETKGSGVSLLNAMIKTTYPCPAK